MAKFKNSDELRSWLDGQSREVSVVIAARAALRVLPLLAFENAATPGKPDAVVDDIVLPVFRVMAVLCSAARYPNARASSTQAESIGDSQGARFLIHTDHR